MSSNGKKTIRYCIFWIPCVTHNELTIIPGCDTLSFPLRKSPEDYDPLYKSKNGLVLYDIVSFAEVVAKGTETEDARYRISLTIRAKIRKDGGLTELFSFLVELKSVEYRHCGLIQFEYSLSEREHQRFDDIKDTVYHQIKSHFHHHYHHTDNESMLKGFYSDKKINLKKFDNKVLSYYITQVHELLSQQVEQIHYEYVFVEHEEHPSDKEHKAARKEFYSNCENLLGQFVFYSSLLNSKRNRSCRIPPLTDSPDFDLQRLAHNIYNLLDALRAIYRKSQSAFYLKNIHETIDIQKAIKCISESNAQLNENNAELSNEIKKIAENNSAFSKVNRQLIDDVKNIANENRDLSVSNGNLIKKVEDSIKSSDAVNKTSKQLGYWSVTLGIISLVIGGVSLWQGCSSKKMENKIDKIEETVQTLSDDVRQSQTEQNSEPDAIMTNKNSHSGKSGKQ